METQSHDAYLKGLDSKSDCKYMKARVLDLCTYSGECRFQGKTSYSISLGKLPECRRAQVMKFKKILG